jgi:hypothetical protein
LPAGTESTPQLDYSPQLAGETHVKIGHGRFYGDVPPIKGVYRGAGGEADHDVSVQMTRLD